jgi:hypothetical protein
MHSVGLLLLVCMSTAAFCATPPDPFDSVLVTYWLTPAEEAQFSDSDGVMSPFWDGWQGRDSVLMLPDSNSVPGYDHWSSPTDALLTLKAAGGSHGLYVLAEVRDDRWADTSAGGLYAGDCLTVFHDTMAAASIRQCTDCLVGHYSSAVTYTTKWFRFPLGGVGTPVQEFIMNMYDPHVWCGVGCPSRYTYAEAKQHLGMRTEVLTSGNRRVIEYNIPWVVLVLLSRFEGVFPPAPSGGIVPACGTRYGFAVDYEDNDTSPPDVAWLAWLRGSVIQGQYWGDLEFGPGFPAVATPVDSLLAVAPRERRRFSGAQFARPAGACYTLSGQRLPLEGGLRDRRGAIVEVGPAEGRAARLNVRW